MARQAVRAATTAPDVQAERGRRVPGSTPAEMQALLERETRRWGLVIRAAKIEPE